MSNPDEESPVILPNDLITEVLSFSDVKSLIQMKCLCKSWNSIISDPKFAKLHLKRSAQNPHLILVSNNVVPFTCLSFDQVLEDHTYNRPLLSIMG
ncbi:putative F-box domain-containing protein [Medicago truncatula]|uniref:F-box and associated interaction domain protein n=1 Tax=Medicago truncatula TaxID=3880 RepID=A0A072UPX0_MEDTR|nr:F-box and associated interaction domain protein [Medicago truncatula]RHN62475.1 putative F-box domain-containing protein [Medicago truncatula]